MGLIDSVKKAFDGDDSNDPSVVQKAKDLINQNQDKVDGAVDKVGDQIDERTGGKYADKVDQVQDTIKDKTGNL